MARRKIDLQDTGRKESERQIDDLVREMGSAELGFSPTDQVIYEVDLARIQPDLSQSRRFLPFDLRERLAEKRLTAQEAMAALVKRAEQGNQLARLILGGEVEALDEEGAGEDDRGLVALARSIRAVGLRQPINLYRLPDSDDPQQAHYQIGEGERRYWAHQLLVLQGFEAFARVRATIEPLPDDQILIQRRQEAENAARQDLSAIARARSIKRIRDRLRIDLGTRVPGQTTIKLPSQRELDEAVGQEVKSFTGRAISDRMVRNYLRLLNLPPGLQDLCEAAQLSEKQLRPVMRLKTEREQLQLIKQIIAERMSGRDVLAKVTAAAPTTSLRRTTPTTLEQRLEKRLFQMAKTAHEVLALGEESYATMIQGLAERISDKSSREALQTLRQVIDDLMQDTEIDQSERLHPVPLTAILPPLGLIQEQLPETYQAALQTIGASGRETMSRLLAWRADDPLVASALAVFFERVEEMAARLEAGEMLTDPALQRLTDGAEAEQPFEFRVLGTPIIYWAHIWLVLRGREQYARLMAMIAA